jgi:hypothetical protein
MRSVFTKPMRDLAPSPRQPADQTLAINGDSRLALQRGAESLHQKEVPIWNWNFWILSPANLRTGCGRRSRTGRLKSTPDPTPPKIAYRLNDSLSFSPWAVINEAEHTRSVRSLPAPESATNRVHTTFLGPPMKDPVSRGQRALVKPQADHRSSS